MNDATRPIRVLLVDDQALLRGSLRLLVDREPDLEVVGEAADGHAAIELAAETRPDVVLMDLRMPRLDGIEATRRILADATRTGRSASTAPSASLDPSAAPAQPAPRVLVLSMFDHDDLVYRALASGASGFVLKDVPPDELLDAIRRTARGDAPLTASITRRLIEHLLRVDPAGVLAPGPSRGADALPELTPRETELLALVGEGCTNDEIATRLTISRATVKTHIGHLLAKLDARDRVQLVIVAFRRGLVR